MTYRRRLTAAGALAAAVSCATVPLPGLAAQSQGAAPPPTYGPPVPGICVFNRRAALDQSAAGRSVGQQMAQLAQSIKNDLGAQHEIIAADDRALAQRRSTLQAAQFQQSVNELKARYAGLERMAKVRQDQMERTAKDAAGLMGRALEPAINEVITQHKCSLVVDTGVVFGANPAMDITGPVIQLLDQRLPGVTVRLAPPRS